jgi:AraC-like DNA-binding protein
MKDKKKVLVERIKVVITEMLHSPDDPILLKLSKHLSKTLDHDYTYMANIFSAEEGSTIEKFYILSKVKRVKELLIYEGLTVTEISYRLHYSSVSHLCLQFKKVTGSTPSVFVKLWETDKCAM